MSGRLVYQSKNRAVLSVSKEIGQSLLSENEQDVNTGYYSVKLSYFVLASLSAVLGSRRSSLLFLRSPGSPSQVEQMALTELSGDSEQ